MTWIQAEVSCPVHDSFRVQQIGGMFDVPVPRAIDAVVCRRYSSGPGRLADRADRRSFGQRQDDCRAGCLRRPAWQTRSTGRTIGRWWIVLARCRLDRSRDCSRRSASARRRLGSSRTRCSAAASGFAAIWPGRWPPVRVRRPDRPTRCRSSCSTSSPAWSIATWRRVGSAAVAKAIRGGQIRCRFVAVTCHYDVTEWLEPDWVIDMADRDVASGGVFGDRHSSLNCFVASIVRGACLRRITI